MSVLCLNSYKISKIHQVLSWAAAFPFTNTSGNQKANGRNHHKLNINSLFPGPCCFHSPSSYSVGDSCFKFHIRLISAAALSSCLPTQQFQRNANTSHWPCPCTKDVIRQCHHWQDNHHSPAGSDASPWIQGDWISLVLCPQLVCWSFPPGSMPLNACAIYSSYILVHSLECLSSSLGHV